MIDNLALGLTHGLLLLTAWRLLSRPDLDDGTAGPPPAAVRKTGWAATDAQSRDA